MDIEARFTDLLVWTHATAGVLSLVMAPLAMVVRKGGDAHRRWGGLFVKGLVVVVITALVLGVLRLQWTLVLLAALAMHLAASGYRSLYHKKLHEGQKPDRGDVLVQGIAAMAHAGALLWGGIHLFFGHKDGNAIIFLIFGLAGMLVVLATTHRFYKRSHDKNEWLYGHMYGMVGGYIVTLVAFSSVNLSMITNDWVRWTWPVAIGMPLVLGWAHYLKGRFVKGRRAKHVYPVRLR